MFCRYCGKKIEEDSTFCTFCGKRLKDSKEHLNIERTTNKNNPNNGTYTAPDGKKYKVIDRIMYDEDGWNVGRVPAYWQNEEW